MTRRTKAQPKSESIYQCEECSGQPQFDFDGIKKHLLDIHKTDVAAVKCNKQMTMHLDGRDYFTSAYSFVFENGVKMTSSTKTMRDDDDPMKY